MEGGLSLYLSQLTNNQIVGNVTPADLLEKVKPATTKGSLKQALADMQEDDNQVVCVATLK